MRIIGPAMGTGHAAGVAASVAIKEGVLPKDIEGTRIRAMLLEDGVNLDQPCDGYWKELRDSDCDMVINGGDFLVLVPKES